MENRPSLDQLLGDAPLTPASNRPPLKDILEGTVAPTKPQVNPEQSFMDWASTPLVSEQQANANPAMKMAGQTLPSWNLISPFLSSLTPPNIRNAQAGKQFSEQTSPLAMVSNLLALKTGQAGKELPSLVKFGGKGTAQKIAESADRGFKAVGKMMSDKYETLFNKIETGSTDSLPIIDSIKNIVDTYPEAAGVPKLKKIMSRLEDNNVISAKQLHDLKQVVRKSIPKSVWSGSTEADAVQNSMRDIYFTITDGLAEIGGDEYKNLSQEFRKVKEAEKLAKKMFYRNGVPSNEPIKGVLDIPTKNAIDTIDKMLPQSDKFANEFKAWRRGNIIKKVAMGGGGVVLGDFLVRSAIRNALPKGRSQ